MYPRVVAGTETPRHLSPSTTGRCKLKATGLNCYCYWRRLVSTVLNLPDLLLYWVGKLLQFRPTLDLSWYLSLILPSWTRPDTPRTQRTIYVECVLMVGLWCFRIAHCSSKTRLIIWSPPRGGFNCGFGMIKDSTKCRGLVVRVRSSCVFSIQCPLLALVFGRVLDWTRPLPDLSREISNGKLWTYWVDLTLVQYGHN